MDMLDCKNKGLVKSVHIDENKIKALLKIVKRKQEAADSLPDKHGDSKFTLLYDSLRIILEYLALKKGLKIYNHECYTAFIKEVLNYSSLGDNFDNFRKIRNAINYYGKELTEEESKDVIIQIKKLIASLEKCKTMN